MPLLTPSFTPTSAQKNYLDTFMNKVSRSFAILIPFLEEPLNHFLATSYLLCRVVDNIEDCQQPAAWKKLRFAEFSQLLKDPTLAADILALWQQQAWPGLTPDEQELMGFQHGLPLWQIYQRIPAEPRQIIDHWTATMARGMSQLEDPHQSPQFIQRQGVQVLAAEEDYNRYCYYVAGTVGHLSTELVINHYRLNNTVAVGLLADCEACGRGLQKTNIIKDFAKDLRRGISYLPDAWLREVNYTPLALAGASPGWVKKVLQNVVHELRDATAYLLSLPYSAPGYRMASLLCLLPAYQTLLLAAEQQEKLFTSQHQVKISHLTMSRCVLDARSMVKDNEAIGRYSRQLEQAIDATFRVPIGLPEP
ncbi:MAG TPA: squalene/phytoene synthase family protein [Anaerolineae bacterium]|nr:squalene/phytoene synthase family protein [Anaerolineae bacterium]